VSAAYLLDGKPVRAWVRDGALTLRGEYDAVIGLVRQRLAAEFGTRTHDGGVWDGHGWHPCRGGAIRNQTSLTEVNRYSRPTAQGLQKRT
jgi:hypothetical protein